MLTVTKVPPEQVPLDLLLLADPSESRVREYLRQGICFVGEDDATIVGCVVLVRQSEERVELANIAVDPRRQGHGFGRTLLQRAIEESKALGAKILTVGTGNSSLRQLAFYQKSGFRIIGVVPDYFPENYDEEIFENGLRCRDMIRLELSLE